MEMKAFQSAIEDLRDRHPFQRFSIVLNNGKRLDIDESDAFSVRDGLFFGIKAGGKPVFLFPREVNEVNAIVTQSA